MNAVELFSRLRDSLKALNYSGTSQPIFGNDGVQVVDRLPEEYIGRWRSPMCFIIEAGSKPYLQDPTVYEQFFTIIFVIENASVRSRESLVLGAHEETTTKNGRGILQIESEIVNHLHGITALSGSKVTFTFLGSNPVKDVKSSSMLKRPMGFSALVDLADDNSYGDEENVLRMPGRVYINPVNLTDNFGTLLGYKDEEILFYSDMQNAIKFLPGDETTGSEFGHAIFTGANPYVVITLLEYTSAVMSLCFPGFENSSDVKGYSVKTGNDFADDANKFKRFLFVPDDKENNKILLLQKVVPVLIQPLGMSRNGNTKYALKLQCMRKTSDDDGVYFLGDIENAVLR